MGYPYRDHAYYVRERCRLLLGREQVANLGRLASYKLPTKNEAVAEPPPRIGSKGNMER
jgi:hypothetical protein